MLTRLSIRNIVLIEALDLEFPGGLGVLTGETGAGKSILLDALGLVLGNRADSGLVRAGEERASVTASFEFGALPPAIRTLLDDAEVDLEAGEPLIVKRQLRSDGGSKAFVNDQPVGVALLRELAGSLVELHGQHDDRGLVNPRGHRALLDRYARADANGVDAAWRDWRASQEALEAARARVAQASADQDLLLAYLAELTALEPVEGEEQQLAEARAAMQKGERLSDDLAALQHLWAGSDSALATLRGAARRLDRIAPEHPLLAEALAALDRAVIEAGEAEEKLERAAEALAHDPAMLDRIETRLFDLRAAARKHGCAVDDLPTKMRELRASLDAIESGEAEIAGLEEAVRTAAETYRARASALHALRLEASARLDAAVAAELAPLKLDAARFRTAVTALPEERWGPAGMDAVEFLISTNPGADFAPLAKIASGGELSRAMLAIKRVLAGVGRAGLYVFDEVDAGVGGAVAEVIGRKLADVARHHQVICITHLAQIAVYAERHYRVAKMVEGERTKSRIDLLDKKERLEEIARMVGGLTISDSHRKAAKEMLDVARAAVR